MRPNINVKIRNLTVSDFPGIDEAKFNEWKALHIKDNREQRIVSYIAIAIGYILTHLFFKSFYTFLIFLTIFVIAGYGFYRAKNKRLRQLGKELKMSDRLWAKKKGRAFTG